MKPLAALYKNFTVVPWTPIVTPCLTQPAMLALEVVHYDVE